MGDVVRLPSQHPWHPHCPDCHAELIEFRDPVLGPFGGVTVLAITYRVRCNGCGAEWDLKVT